MQLNTWVVVAESSRARIFRMDNINAPLVEIADMQHSESRLHERDLMSDRPGRTFDSQGGGRHAKEPGLTAKKAETDSFAKSVAEYINTECEKGVFEKLILISAPEFLGLLRKHLDENVKQHITREIDKNIVKQNEALIRKELIA